MISDVLFEAIQEIERYQADFPQAYDPCRPMIESTKHAMRKLLAFLDTPPSVLAAPTMRGKSALAASTQSPKE